jgi:hypothetical protein
MIRLMPPHPRVARKLLIASIGVATMSYVATACSSSSSTGPAADAGKGDVVDDFPVANLAQFPDSQMRDTSAPDVMDDFPVANLVVMPDASAG